MVLVRALGIVAVLVGTTMGAVACGAAAEPPLPNTSSEPAVWQLSDPSALGAETTSFEVAATRMECADGVTGELHDPLVTYEDARVVVRIDAAPDGKDVATCPENDAVTLTITLSEPLGDRTLVDGACLETDAARTVYCDDPVRWTP